MKKSELNHLAAETSLSDSILPDPSAMLALNGKAVETMSLASRAMAESAKKIGETISEFYAERMKKDLAAGQTLSSCRTPDEVYRAQCAFLEQAIADYAKEASRMIEIGAEMAISTLHPIEETGEEVLRSMEAQAHAKAEAAGREARHAKHAVEETAS